MEGNETGRKPDEMGPYTRSHSGLIRTLPADKLAASGTTSNGASIINHVTMCQRVDCLPFQSFPFSGPFVEVSRLIVPDPCRIVARSIQDSYGILAGFLQGFMQRFFGSVLGLFKS